MTNRSFAKLASSTGETHFTELNNNQINLMRKNSKHQQIETSPLNSDHQNHPQR